MLRLYDEIKDFQVDTIIHPHRPLVRKLLSHRDLHNAIIICIFIEVVISSFFGRQTLLAIGIALLYSLLMFKEFFVKDWIRQHLTFYAITHTFVACLFSLTLFSALTLHSIWTFSPNAYVFVLVNWLVFTLYEFGRKTYVTSEEKIHVDSYSKVFGRVGAVLLVVSMALVISLLLFQAASLETFVLSLILLLFLMLLGATFALSNQAYWAKCYRIATLSYIGLLYLSIIV